MAADTAAPGAGAPWSRLGLQGIPTLRGLAALQTALESPHAQLMVAPAQWSTVSQSIPHTYLFEALLGHAPALPVVAKTPSAPGLVAASQTTHAVLAVVRDTLRLAAAHQVSLRQPLRELGLDSMLSLELRRALEKQFDVMLAPTFAYDCPTVESMVTHLRNAGEPAVAVVSGHINAEENDLDVVNKLFDEMQKDLRLGDIAKLLSDT